MGSEPNYITGPDLEGRWEVRDVKKRLADMHIFLDGFGVTITGVFTRPRPYGFTFDCKLPMALLELARSRMQLNRDDTQTRLGSFMAKETLGTGFRQIGRDYGLHLEIALNGHCNVHVDSHGPVVAPGEYGFNAALEHGYWDLFADKVPQAFLSWGERGQAGPMVGPMKGVDGNISWVVSLWGHW